MNMIATAAIWFHYRIAGPHNRIADLYSRIAGLHNRIADPYNRIAGSS